MAIRNINKAQSAPEDQVESEQGSHSLKGLFSELGGEFSQLFREETALARAETSQKISQARSGVTMMAMGGILAFAGLFVLMMAAVYALSDIMHPGWAALIIGAVGALIGYAIVKSGSNNLKAKNLMPQRTEQSLKRDADMLKQEAKTATGRKQQ